MSETKPCICSRAPEAWRQCPVPDHDHTRWTEHGWNCPASCNHPDAIAAHATEAVACPFCGAEPDPNAFLNCGGECRNAGEHTQEPGCFYIGVALEPCCPSNRYEAGLLAAREVLRHGDEQLSVRKRRGGITVIRFTSGTAYMEVGLEREPFALLTDDEKARIARLLDGGS